MAVLKLTYCQLIKIILSQIGGSPLQQYITAQIAGMPSIVKAGLIPAELAAVKQLIDQITTAVNAAATTARDFSNIAGNIAQQIFRNPVAAASTLLQERIDARIAALNAIAETGTLTSEQQEELTELTSTKAQLTTFKKYTDILAGVGDPTGEGGLGMCSLQDLLGTGCNPNTEVPDIDLQTLQRALTLENVINSLASRLAQETGFNDLRNAVASFKQDISNINITFETVFSKTVIKGAALAVINQIVYNLLSGCGSGAYELTIKPEIKDTISKYAAVMQEIQQGNAYYSDNSNTIVRVTSWGD